MESALRNSNGESRSAAAVKDRRTDALGDLRVLPDEIVCVILTRLTPHDVARLSCVSSVMYILCNEEPLWMDLCLGIVNRQIEYKGSWKKTALHQLDLLHKYNEASRRTLQFDGFSSLFLYRRLYRCHTSLNGFSFDDGNVKRKENISFEEFHMEYDCQKPAELAAYMESSKSSGKEEDPEMKTRADIEAAINSAKKELTDVKLKIEKATKEVNIMKVASASLQSQLEKESAQLHSLWQREGMASIAAASLETELSRIKSEINIIQMKEREEREKLVELPMQLQKAAQEAEQAKALARAAGDELNKAKDEAEEAKAGVSARETKLRAVKKEIEAAKASERLALAAITALQASESAQRNVDEADLANGITLLLEEYYELSKRAHEAEEQANARVAASMSQIEAAKEAELKSLNKLEEVSRDMSKRKDALEVALHTAEQAAERKLSAEQELRKWRADHEQKRKNGDSAPSHIKTGKESKKHHSSSNHQMSPKNDKGADPAQEGKGGKKKKKKSFFPRFFMFLGKKKSHSSKGE